LATKNIRHNNVVSLRVMPNSDYGKQSKIVLFRTKEYIYFCPLREGMNGVDVIGTLFLAIKTIIDIGK